MVEFTVHGVALDRKTGMPLVVLCSPEENLCVGIQVGPSEASSIIVELEGVQPPRPLTHDLLGELFIRHGFRLEQVQIYDNIADRNLARIHYSKGFRKYSMETRPSDAIAMAIRLTAPIYIEEGCIPSLVFLHDDGPDGDESDFLYLENQQINSQVV